MGNASSLSMAAMSYTMHINQTDVFRLRGRLLELSWIDASLLIDKRHQSDTENVIPTKYTYGVNHEDFSRALQDVRITHEYDTKILNLLFIMIDTNGSNRVNPMDFLVGISPLAIITSPLETLRFALEVKDVRGDGRIRHNDFLQCLKSVSNIASFIGDPVLPASEIEQFTNDVFQGNRIIWYKDKLMAMSNHYLFQKFIHGNGTFHLYLIQQKDEDNEQSTADAFRS